MSKKRIIIRIPFNTSNHNGEERFTREWIDYRISVFMKFTLESLKNQTNQEFITLVRYVPETEDLIQQALRKYDRLPTNILFISNSDYKEFIINDIKNYNDLYLVRLDSDDMYHQSFIQQLYDYDHKEKTKVLINQYGYIYDSLRHLVCAVKRKSPPFYVELYKSKNYIEGERHRITGHNRAIQLPHEIIKERNYVIVIHSNNTASYYDVDEERSMHNGEEKKILKEFMGEDGL